MRIQVPPAEKLLKQGQGFLNGKKLNEAIRASQQLNTSYPNDAQGWHFTSQVALALGNMDAASQSLKNACKLASEYVPWKIALANIYVQKTEFLAAKELITLLSKTQLSALQHNQLAMLCAQVQLSSEAIRHYQLAIELEPENHEHYYSLAAVLRHTGDLEQAENYLNQAVALEPLDVDAQTLRVDLKKQSAEHNYIAPLKALLTQKISAKQAVQVYFALAKSYEDMALYPQSFEYLRQGARLRRQHINYDLRQDIETMADISQCFDQKWWQKTANAGTPPSSVCQAPPLTPIFILGMPRTGSTLSEQILTAGENVHAGGELYDFSHLLSEHVKSQFSGKVKTKHDFVLASSEIDYAQLGQDYLHSVRSRLGLAANEGQYFTDKLPFNFLSVGLIQKALPEAKIVHITRAPMDTCYAIFKTLFQQAYPYSYDQVELAQYFSAYKKLMSHWQQLLGDGVYQLNYEELVHSPEKVSEELYQFCGISWRPEFAQMQNNTSTVTTASASQVRQAIHQGSVQKWRHYESQLQALKTRLEQEGIHCD